MQHIRFRIELQVWTCDVEKQTFEGEFCAYSGVWFLFQSNVARRKNDFVVFFKQQRN